MKTLFVSKKKKKKPIMVTILCVALRVTVNDPQVRESTFIPRSHAFIRFLY